MKLPDNQLNIIVPVLKNGVFYQKKLKGWAETIYRPEFSEEALHEWEKQKKRNTDISLHPVTLQSIESRKKKKAITDVKLKKLEELKEKGSLDDSNQVLDYFLGKERVTLTINVVNGAKSSQILRPRMINQRQG